MMRNSTQTAVTNMTIKGMLENQIKLMSIMSKNNAARRSSSNYCIVGFQCHATQNKNKSKSKPFNRLSPESGKRTKSEYAETPAEIQVTAIFSYARYTDKLFCHT